MSDARLHITDAQGRRVVRLDRPRSLLGRRGHADVQIVGTDVSREHAEIVQDNGRYLLRDLGSRFGTQINGEPIQERLLRHGDRIGLGKSGAAAMVFLTDSSSTGILGTASNRDQLGLVAALLDGLRALGSGRVLDEVLTLVIDSAIQVTGAERGFIMLANPDGHLEFTIARGRGRTTLPDSSFVTSEKIPRDVFRTGRSALVDDLADERWQAEHGRTRAEGIRQVRCVPLRVTPMKTSAQATQSSRVMGVLYLDSRDRRSVTADTTQSWLEAFATQAAIAISSARLYGESAEKHRIEQELRLAAQYQHALFPDSVFEGRSVDLAAVSIPCRTVGGDFFEYLELGDAFGFALGDVAGKGPPAALLATFVQANFTAQASVSTNPAEAMTRLNEVLLRRAIEARFATMFYGMVNAEGTLTYCNAGQEPPLLIAKTTVTPLESGGPVLGLLPLASYEFGTVALQPGDLIVVFSDGVTEARRSDAEEFGQARLIDTMRGCHGAQPESTLDQLMQAVRIFSDGEAQGDDLTALVLRYRGNRNPGDLHNTRSER